MKRFDDLCAQVSQFIGEHELLKPGEPVLVALSGGLDSMMLLRVLLALGYPVHVAHYDHRWRTASASEAEWLATWCARMGVSVSLGVASGAGASSEAEARVQRYHFLRNCAIARGVTQIATGHHLNDQAETVLFRIARGAGVDGACGIWPKSFWLQDVVLIRPLLDVSREVLEAVGRGLALEPFVDPSNLDLRYGRNRIRHRVLPELVRVSPDAVKHYARFATRLQQELPAWREYEDRWCRTWTRRTAPGVLEIDGQAFCDEHRACQQRLLRAFGQSLGYGTVDNETVTRSLAAITSDSRRWHLEWPRGARLHREEVDLFLVVAAQEPAPVPFVRDVSQGTEGWGWTVTVQSSLTGAALHACRVAFDAAQLPQGLVWRSARPRTDRMRPFGHTRTRSLMSYLNGRGIRGPQQDGLLVLASGSDVFWVVGVGRSALAQVELLEKTPENPCEIWASAFFDV